MLLELGLHVSISLVGWFLDNFGDFLGDLGLRINLVNVNRSFAIEAATCGDAAGIF